MTTNIIEYTEFIGLNYYTPLSVDGVGYDLESEYSESTKDSVYSGCPAWKHKSNRIYTVRSPISVQLSVDVSNKHLQSDLSQAQFDEYLSETFTTINPSGWCTEEKTTIQMSIPRFLFSQKASLISIFYLV